MTPEEIRKCEKSRIGINKLNAIRGLLLMVLGYKGATAEVGVYWGWTSREIAENNGNVKHYCYDTFKGIPNANKEYDPCYSKFMGTGGHEKMFSDVDYQYMMENILTYPNIVMRVGKFPDTIEEERDELFKLVHVDGDVYQTAKDSLDFFYPRMLEGGFMVFDDWNLKSTAGVDRVVKEWSKKNNVPWFELTSNQAVIRKPFKYEKQGQIHQIG